MPDDDELWKAVTELRGAVADLRVQLARREEQAAADRLGMGRVEAMLSALGAKVDALLMAQAGRAGGMRVGNWLFAAATSLLGLISGWAAALFHRGP